LKHRPAPAARSALVALRDELSSNALHDEDGVGRPDRIRERIFGLTGPFGGNLQPPFEQHQAALDALKPDVIATYARIRAVLGFEFGKTIGMHRLDPPAHAIVVAPTPSP
jgi:hypothetical protein